jgi:hypothetical protein
MKTTYAQQLQQEPRTNTNEAVLREANSRLDTGGKQVQKRIILMSKEYEKRRQILYAKIVASNDEDPKRTVTFERSTIRRPDYGLKRRGKPKNNWVKEAEKLFWESTVKQRHQEMRLGDLDLHNQTHINLIEETAKQIVAEQQATHNTASRSSANTRRDQKTTRRNRPSAQQRWQQPTRPHLFSLADAGLHIA